MRHGRERGPRRLGVAVEAVAGELAPDTPLARIQRAWRGAVGDAIAAEAEPVGERGGVVTVACRSSVWAQELDLLSVEVVRRLNAGLGEDVVERLRCVATPPPGSP
jgi:predicted nucleic acid-binding Zn ribbon protein